MAAAGSNRWPSGCYGLVTDGNGCRPGIGAATSGHGHGERSVTRRGMDPDTRARPDADRGEPRGGDRARRHRHRAAREQARAPVDRRASTRATRSREGLLSGELGIVPLIVPYEVGVPPGAARLPEPGRRPDRLRGAAHGLHGRRLARAADAARPPALPARDGDAPGRGHRRARRPGARRGRVGARADRRGALPLGARVGRPGRLARSRAPCGPSSRSRWPSSRSAPRAPASRSSSRATTAITLEMRPRMLRVVAQNLAENAIRYAGPGTTFTLAVERDDGQRRPARHATTASASTRRSCRGCSSASTAPTTRAPRAARGSGSRS